MGGTADREPPDAARRLCRLWPSRTTTLPAVVTTVDDSRFLDDFAREVEKQFKAGGKIDLDMVARTFKMGESQLRHKVQTLTGKNVPAYIIQLRMEKAMRLLQKLYEYYLEHVEEMPEEYINLIWIRHDSPSRAVCDYVAGMTDGYAMETYGAIFIPAAWSVK